MKDPIVRVVQSANAQKMNIIKTKNNKKGYRLNQ